MTQKFHIGVPFPLPPSLVFRCCLKFTPTFKAFLTAFTWRYICRRSLFIRVNFDLKKDHQPTPFQTNMMAYCGKSHLLRGDKWQAVMFFLHPYFFFRIYTVAWCTKQRIMTIQSLSSLSLRGDQPNRWNIWNLRYFKVGKTSMTSLNLTFLGYLGPVIEVRLWKSSRSFIYNYQGLQGSILDQKLGVLFQPKKKLSLHLPLFLFSGKNILHPISHKMS